MTNFELLQRLCETPGVPGREEQIRALIVREMTPLVDEIRVDKMGSVIGTKKGMDGPTVMIAAHMDEIGFIVKHVDDKGFVRVQPLGGFDPRNLVAQRVHVHCHTGEVLLGTMRPTAEAPDADRSKARKLTDIYIDLGLSGDAAKQKVELGDPVTMARTCERIGENVVSKSLDNRLSVFVMLEALRTMSVSRCTIHAVATVQEEIGLRGATPAAFALQPDIGIALDVTLAGDFPGGSDPERVTELGKGTAIKIMDSSLICDRRIVKDFRRVAEAHSIPYQLEILSAGGTDAGAIQRSRGGVPAFTLSTPTRYIHTVNEMASVRDIEAGIQLLATWLEEAHQLDLT